MFGCLPRKELKSLEVGEKEDAQEAETTNTEHEISQGQKKILRNKPFIFNTQIEPQPEKEQKREPHEEPVTSKNKNTAKI